MKAGEGVAGGSGVGRGCRSGDGDECKRRLRGCRGNWRHGGSEHRRVCRIYRRRDVGTGVHAVKVTTIAHNINALKVNVLTTNSSTWVDGSQDNLSKVRKIGSLREVPGAERPESRS